MTNRRKSTQRFILLLIAGLVCAGAGHVLYRNRWHVWPKRFAVVEPGWLYRGGQVDAGLIEPLIDKYHIEGILALTWLRPDKPDEAAELALVRERGLDLGLIPMPGNGLADFDKLDEAADWIEAHEGRPVFVHCAAGVNRTGAAIAAYRMKHCGWSLERALGEARHYGARDRDDEMKTHLTRYYDHVLQSKRLEPARDEG